MTRVERILYIRVKFECVVDGRNSFKPTPQIFQSKGEMDDSEISLTDWKNKIHARFSEVMTKDLIEKCEKFASAHRLGKNLTFEIVNVTERVIGKIDDGIPIDDIKEFISIGNDEIEIPSKLDFEDVIYRKGYTSKITDIETGEITEIKVRPSSSRKWTGKEIEFISDVYGKVSTDMIAEKLQRSKKSIWSKIGSMRKQGLV